MPKLNTPPATPHDFVPAYVHYYPGKRAAVTHPSGDDSHDNAILTRQRLVAAGYRIVAYVQASSATSTSPQTQGTP